MFCGRVPRVKSFRKGASFHSSARSSIDIKNVTVFGSGLMGSGIAQISAESGYNVTMVDVSEDFLLKGETFTHTHCLLQNFLISSIVQAKESSQRVCKESPKRSLNPTQAKERIT